MVIIQIYLSNAICRKKATSKNLYKIYDLNISLHIIRFT